MKLKEARYCANCDEVYDRLRTLICGQRDISICPSCGSSSTIYISVWLNRTVQGAFELPIGEVCI